MSHDDSSAVEGAIDLLGTSGIGPLWGLASTGLNATLLARPAGHRDRRARQRGVDVLVVVLEGHGSAVIDGATHTLAAGSAILIARETRRDITAGDGGLRHLRPPAPRAVADSAGPAALTSRGGLSAP